MRGQAAPVAIVDEAQEPAAATVESNAPEVVEDVSADIEPLEADAGEENLSTFDIGEAEDEDPPFDPPDVDEDELLLDDGDEAALDKVESAPSSPIVSDAVLELTAKQESQPTGKPAPAISVHVSWDRPEAAELVASLANDARMVRVMLSESRGGLGDAVARFTVEESPDLLIVDTTLSAQPMLAALDRVMAVLRPGVKIVVIGAVNDVPLLRELMRRGVSQYLLAPVQPGPVIEAICGLFAEADNSRVFAVIGARGGVGASALAFNLAWCIAETRQAVTTLVDLDLPFGACAVGAEGARGPMLADGLLAPHLLDEPFLEAATVQKSDRLRVLPAPASLECDGDFDPEVLQAMIEQVRRTSSFVILDLPHAWNPGVKHALAQADEVLLVAAPDLASMRNAKNMLDALKLLRTPAREPVVALSMVGAPKRPEISVKEFSDAIAAAPIASFAFDPGAFGLAELKGLAVGEVAPHSKSAHAIDVLAGLLTGLKPRPAARKKPAPKSADAGEKTARPVVHEIEVTSPSAPAPAPVAAAEPVEEVSELVSDLVLELNADHGCDAPALDLQEAEPPPPAPAPDVAPQPRRVRAPKALRRPHSGRGRPGTVRAVAALVMLAIAGGSYLQALNGAAASPSMQPRPAAAAPAPASSATPLSDPQTQYESALSLLSEDQAAVAAALLLQAAERGHVGAQYRLAKLYEAGEGVLADLAAARSWTERAAAAGDTLAMHDLGLYLASGQGGARDEAAAYRWFLQAAERGVAASQYNLGLLYEQGRGVTANAEEALFWHLLASRQGDESARARVAAVEQLLTAEEIAQTQARAQAFAPRAAE